MICDQKFFGGSLHSAAQHLVQGLVTFSISQGINLVDEMTITAVNLMGIDANNRACTYVSLSMLIKQSCREDTIPYCSCICLIRLV